MNRIAWSASSDASTASYDIELASDPAGPWSLLTNVPHDLNGANYDPIAREFFLQDSSSPASSWYRVTVVGSGGQRSLSSTPFQGRGLLASLADLKDYLSKEDASDDAVLGRLLASASDFMERQTGRKFALATYGPETHRWTGERAIVPRNYPVVSVASVSLDGNLVDPETDNAPGWFLDGNVIRLDDVSSRYWLGRTRAGRATIVYSAGYADIPGDIQQAVIELAALKFRERPHIGQASQTLQGSSMSFLPSIVPLSVQAVIDSYRGVLF